MTSSSPSSPNDISRHRSGLHEVAHAGGEAIELHRLCDRWLGCFAEGRLKPIIDSALPLLLAIERK